LLGGFSLLNLLLKLLFRLLRLLLRELQGLRCQHTSAHVSTRQHTSACVSIRHFFTSSAFIFASCKV
jgi:hypothetical protein